MVKNIIGDLWAEVPETDLEFKFFSYFLFTFVWEINSDTLFRIGRNSFTLVSSTFIYDRVARSGTEISEEWALLFSKLNHVPLNIRKWLKGEGKCEKPYSHKDRVKYYNYDGDKYFYDVNSMDLYKIYPSSFQKVKCGIRFSKIRSDGSVISEDDALRNTIFESLPLEKINDFIIEDDPHYVKLHTPDVGEQLDYLEYDELYYVTKEENQNVLRIEAESFCYIRDEKLISRIKEQGKRISRNEAFRKSSKSKIPDYLMRTLFKGPKLCSCVSTKYKDLLEWPADCYPHLKSRFVEEGKIEITFYFSVNEDEYETMCGDGLSYHYDRPFFSEKNVNRYVELRNSENQTNYESRNLLIKLIGNQFLFFNPSSSLEEYQPEYILQGLDNICSDPLYPGKVFDLLKLYCVLDRRNRCKELIKMFKFRLDSIGMKTKYIDSESDLYYSLLMPFQKYSHCEPFINDNTEYPFGSFAQCATYLDLQRFHFVDKLRNVISIFEHVYAMVLQIDFKIEEPDTDEIKNPPFNWCVSALQKIIEDLKDQLIDMGRMMEGDFEPFLFK